VVADASGVPVFGSFVTLTGSAQQKVFTNFSGAYSFSVKPGSYSVSAAGGCLGFEPGVVNLNNLKSNATVNFLGTGNNVITNCEPAPNSGAFSGSLNISGDVTSNGAGVPGVTVTLSGSTDGVRVTDETGAYSFSVNPGSYSVAASGACASFSPGLVNKNNISASQTQNFAGTNCPPAPLALCPTLDSLFIGQNGGAACAHVTTLSCPDREDTWVSDILFSFAGVNSADCRYGQFASVLTQTDVDNYITNLSNFILQFFGCPFVGTLTGPLSFALLPPGLPSGVTTADLAGLSQDFVTGITEAIAQNGSPPLTAPQLASINAQLTYLQTTVAGAVKSSKYTYSTCTADGGAN
jgi:hypothetical protein